MDVYQTYDAAWLNADLSAYLESDEGSGVSFVGKYPADFLVRPRADELVAWHLVGGRDPIDEAELAGDESDDGYPVLLRDWIRRDALKCLKVKLRGTDAAWDYDRLVKMGDEEIRDIYAYMRVLAKLKPGDEVEAVVIRQGKEQKLRVKLQASRRPPGDD